MLDWLVARKPKEGKAEEVAELVILINASIGHKRNQDLVDYFQSITLSGEDTLNAPTIGVDISAEAWLREQCDKSNAFDPYWGRPFEYILKDNQGKRIVELTGYNKSTYQSPIKDKHPTSFMGNILLDIVGLPESIKMEAEEEHDPQEALAFATRLELKTLKMFGESRVKALAASDWLKFWAEKGHGFIPWS